MVVAGLGGSSSEVEEDPTPKRRRLHRGNQITTDDADEEEGDYPYTVARIIDRRGCMSAGQYLVQWEDKTAEYASELINCANLVRTCDRCLEKHPDRLESYASLFPWMCPASS